ncbi:MAG: MtrAB system histidine kinase MtrB [Kineosporiaceae bacterium]
MRSRWRRSLLLRVVAATLALGILVLLVVGQLLLQAISDGLVDSARTAAQNDATQQTQNTIYSHRAQKFEDEQEFRTWTAQKLNDLHGPADAPLRYVALLKALGTAPGPMTDQGLGVVPSAIPTELRREVAASHDQLITQVLTLPVRDESGGMTEQGVIAVGSALDLGPLGAGADEQGRGRYELYFVYPLAREVAILANVQRTFLVGAVALLVLIGLVAWVVTRQVVDPVRQAALAAEQLASGRLDRRMPVRGEDDLARLGRAFNEMAASLERQIHQLEELSRVQRRFVSDVSHELRTPLTTIRMAGEVIYEARADFDPALARTSELLQTQLDRFESLLSDLLEVSRFDAGAAVLEGEPVDLRKLVHRVVDHLRPLAERRGSRLTVHEPRGVVLAEVDGRRVERILRNLLGNAIEHGEGRPVEVRVAMDDEAVAIGVRDHGVGLSQADVRLVFDRFWRGDPARARSTGGTGLGLAIALEDAHLHGGWLQAWGEPGAGAHFRLTLPRHGGAVLAGSPLPLVPLDAPAATRSGALTAPGRA